MSLKIKMNSNRGITLVALIITIIVLLILAMVSIRLVMNGGIIDKSKNAVDKYSNEEIMEQIKLAYQEYQMAKYTEEGYTLQNALAKTGLNIASVEGNDSTGYEVKVNTKDGEKSFMIQANGSVEIASTEWTDNGDGSYSKGIKKIKIGDIVNYNELSNGEKSYTTDITKGIAENKGGQNSTTGRYEIYSGTYETEDLTWRVLRVNGKGQVELISENPMIVRGGVYLANEEGYLYGPEALNEMCDDLYGKGNGAESARSLNLDDVDKLAGITTDADKKTLSGNYGNKWKYRYPTTTEVTGTRYMQYNADTGSGYSNSWTNITNSSYQKFRMPGESTTINSTNPGYSPELTYTSYNYLISQKVNKTATDGKSMADLLAKGTTSSNLKQWIVSRYVLPGSWSVSFGVGYIGDGYVCGRATYSSNDKGNAVARPYSSGSYFKI